MIGIDLIKKENTCQEDPLAVGLTFPLLLDHKNQKFGKSENNAYFLDPSLTSPYALYQYLINLADDLTCQLLRYLSSSQLSEVDTLIQQHVDKPCMKFVQKALVRELLPSIHPNESVDELEITSYKLFNASDELTKKDFASIKSTIPTIEIKEPSSIGSILKQLGFVSSSSEAARLIKEKCVYCFGKNILNANQNLIEEDMRFKYSLIKKGKKEYGLVFHAY